jgi:hypothetical protein
MDTITRTFAAVPRLVVRIVMSLALLSATAAVAAAVNPQWIEQVLGLSPDAGSGEAEIELVLAFAVTALLLIGFSAAAALAARSVRSAAPVAGSGGAGGSPS